MAENGTCYWDNFAQLPFNINFIVFSVIGALLDQIQFKAPFSWKLPFTIFPCPAQIINRCPLTLTSLASLFAASDEF